MTPAWNSTNSKASMYHFERDSAKTTNKDVAKKVHYSEKNIYVL